MINEVFGWVWITVGFAAGALLGPAMSRADWLGGYTSERRRYLRLAHISLVMLGVLNILFAHGVRDHTSASGIVTAASVGLIVGAVTMPMVCGLSAWRPGFRALFPVPVLSLIAGGALTAAGMVLS